MVPVFDRCCSTSIPCSTFFWLVSLLCTALFAWPFLPFSRSSYLLIPLLLYAIAFQEAYRCLLNYGLR